ncbi:Ankyrin-3 [Phytophthora citrophthora]|uniref:Ankyrin-3 n=1 Tax=Phytophthora citrophthora TaxID=4793 RepID=A0AAD9GLY4_9STRA|nr:Ankyrin-3 [Phytophthora citrophthora]
MNVSLQTIESYIEDQQIETISVEQLRHGWQQFREEAIKEINTLIERAISEETFHFDINAKDEFGRTALHNAALTSNAEVVSILLDRGSSVTAVENDGSTALHFAALKSNAEIVSILLDGGSSVTVVDKYGWTALHFAALKSNAEIVSILLDRGSSVTAVAKDGRTALHNAARNSNAEIVSILLEGGSSVTAVENDGRTALHNAARNSNAEIVSILLDRGSSVTAVAKDGRTALHNAARNSNAEIVSILLDRGSSVTAVENDGSTALHIAAYHSNAEIVSILLDGGSSVTAVDKDGSTALHIAARYSNAEIISILLDRGFSLTAVDKDGRTDLYNAARKSNAEIVSILLDRGSSVTAVDKDGSTALHLAALTSNAEVVSILLDRGSSVTAVENDGSTALHFAALKSNAEIVSILLDGGSSVTVVDKYGWTALHFAALKSNAEIVSILLDRGSSVTAVAKDGSTALHIAAEESNAKIVSILLEGGSSVTAVDNGGSTALHLAAEESNAEIVSILLDRGSSVTADGRTALHNAALKSNAEIVSILLDGGSSVTAVDKKGSTALHFAARYRNQEVVNLLLDAGAEIDVVDTSGNNALSYLLLSDTDAFNKDNISVACFLCSRELKLRPLDEMPSLEKHQLGLLACIEHWQQSYDRHWSLFEVPFETVNSDDVVYRRKICIVGPSTWGKSSLVRSMIEEQPILVPLANRTTGIDLFSMDFMEGEEENKKKHHDITFWDFAGQDVYHVAHAVFFSTRALYLVCIDLKKYADMLEKANEASTWEREHPRQRFFEEEILRWMVLILIRQPDAQFKLIGTKADLVESTSLTRVVNDVKIRLTVFLDHPNHYVEFSTKVKEALRTLRSEVNGGFVEASVNSTQQAKDAIKATIIANPDRSFQMPKSFTQVLDHIIDKRKRAASSTTQQGRMKEVIMPVNALCHELMDIEGIGRPESADTCKEILRALHELGDVLWYEDIDEFQDLIILDPTVMLDLTREVINHNYKDKEGKCYDKLRRDGTLQHSLLMTFPAWKGLGNLGGNLVKLFKSLLLRLNLAYPVNNMEDLSEADLIVPTYWKSRDKAARRPLRRQGSVLEQNGVMAKWRYSVPISVSDTLFENLVTQCYRPYVQRQVRASYFELSVSKEFTAVIYLESNKTKRLNDITIEVVAATEENAWAEMRHFVVSMEKILHKNHPGLSKVNRCIVEVIGELREKNHEVNDLMDNDDDESQLRRKAPWLPPNFNWFRERVWINPGQTLVALDLKHRLEVLERLLITGDKRHYPATWTISYPEEGSPIELRVHSDVTGKCFHRPLLIPVTHNFLTEHSTVVKIGITLLSIACSTIPIPVISAAVDEALSESRNAFEARVDRANATKATVDKAQLNPGDMKGYNELGMGPKATMGFLRELIKHHDPPYDEFTIGDACNLYCAATTNGCYVWVGKSEMETMKEQLTLYKPETRPPIDLQSSPSSPESVSFTITVMTQSSGAGCLPLIANTYYCEWEIVHSSSPKAIAGDTTEKFKSMDAGLSLKKSETVLESVDSIEMLRDCTLRVYLKKARRLTRYIRGDKEIGQGEELLSARITTDCFTSQTIRIPITVNFAKVSHIITCEVNVKFTT